MKNLYNKVEEKNNILLKFHHRIESLNKRKKKTATAKNSLSSINEIEQNTNEKPTEKIKRDRKRLISNPIAIKERVKKASLLNDPKSKLTKSILSKLEENSKDLDFLVTSKNVRENKLLDCCLTPLPKGIYKKNKQIMGRIDGQKNVFIIDQLDYSEEERSPKLRKKSSIDSYNRLLCPSNGIEINPNPNSNTNTNITKAFKRMSNVKGIKLNHDNNNVFSKLKTEINRNSKNDIDINSPTLTSRIRKSIHINNDNQSKLNESKLTKVRKNTKLNLRKRIRMFQN
jgi:hypothetical protein